MIDNQFYPTPKGLALKAWEKFQDKDPALLLEPQAGRGDFLDAISEERRGHGGWYGRAPILCECVEIDLQNQAILREKGYRVIDGDFLAFKGGGAEYSHILMNPPFAKGVEHTLKAWEILYSGELVSIVNAESIRNPRGPKADHLARLVADHGEVEYLQEEFLTEDTQRKTAVEIALLHLVKKPSVREDFFHFPDGLKLDQTPVIQGLPEKGKAVTVRESSIESLVRCFDIAVEKMRAAVIADAEATYFARFIEIALAGEEAKDISAAGIQTEINKRYTALKADAWRRVLGATEFTERLSSQAQKRLEAEMERVRELEFTKANIWGLLAGLVCQKDQMDRDMICDVFDQFTRFHSGNRAYYRGWKSNDKHRENAWRLKTTRVVIPIGGGEFGIQYDRKQELHDIDKVFAMMDGKQKPTLGLLDMVSGGKEQEIKSAERFKTDYFDLRYYRGTGTLHLFPTRKDLIDRMNRVVGRMRAWLPDESTEADPRFWNQYEKAEKVTAEMDRISKRRPRGAWWLDEKERQTVERHAEACENLGIELPDLLPEGHSEARKQIAV